MKKRFFALLVLCIALVASLGLSACVKPDSGITVTLSGYTETTVFDGSRVTLKATVEGEMEGMTGKVTWATSDADVAKVTNGVVAFQKVAEDKTVTITATSRDDTSKSASVEFTVTHCMLDLNNSRGIADSSLFITEGSIMTETADTAILFSDVYGTKWYVEAAISIEEQDETDDYPKIGIMTGSDANGYWNGSTAENRVKNLFFYVDSQRAGASTGWVNFNLVGQNGEGTDWSWGNQKGGFGVTSANKMEMYTAYRMGLLRDGTTYYLFAQDGEGMKCYKKVEYTDIAADEPTYAWIGGWKTGMTVSGFNYAIGDAVDAYYATPNNLELAEEKAIVFSGNTYQIDVTADVVNFNKAGLSYEVADPSVCTVDANGLLTAADIQGAASTTVTVAYGEVEVQLEVLVSDDPTINVVLDGKAEDELWSADVMAKPVTISSAKATLNVYASRNALGIYFFVKYETPSSFAAASNWWEGDNFELRLLDVNGLLENATEVSLNSGNKAQYWASSYRGGNHNFTDGFITNPALNAETNLYEINFEMFVSYAFCGISANDYVGFHFGANPGGNAWFNSNGWGNNDIAANYKITADGIVDKLDPETCGHYYIWNETKAPTCTVPGEETGTCKLCDGTTTREIPVSEDHVADMNTLEVTQPSTCVTAGKAVAKCTGYDVCGGTVIVDLPIDVTNHEAWDAAQGKCTKCGSYEETYAEPILYDRWNAGGWGGVGDWHYFAMGLAGDFEVTVSYDLQVNDPNGGWWKGILPVVQEELPAGAEGEGSCWVTRLDWWGWCDQWQSASPLGNYDNTAEFRLGDWGEANNAMYVPVVADCSIVWTCKREGTTVTNSFVIVANGESEYKGRTFNFWSKLKNVDLSKKLSVAFSGEFAKATIKSVKVDAKMI
ncbi:MAG: Ig-like domain-containing protein [Clostridia bacterium]|nr:Ig-like domain-containing protein [Clostridia bacterium]